MYTQKNTQKYSSISQIFMTAKSETRRQSGGSQPNQAGLVLGLTQSLNNKH
jgi:hypothetical protein